MKTYRKVGCLGLFPTFRSSLGSFAGLGRTACHDEDVKDDGEKEATDFLTAIERTTVGRSNSLSAPENSNFSTLRLHSK